MGQNPQTKQSAASPLPTTLSRLTADPHPAAIAEIVEEMGLWRDGPPQPGAPRLLLNMVSSADGRATLAGRSGGLSDKSDRALFHGLRNAVDAVLVGAGTLRSERYGRLIPDEARRQVRIERGLPAEPLACVVSESLQFGQDVPLLQEPEARVAILTGSADTVSDARAQVDYIRTGSGGGCDLARALAEIAGRYEVSSVLCEGGPHLACQLLEAGLVDELFLSISPTLLGGRPGDDKALRILAGGELTPPVSMELFGVLQGASSLFLRYGVSERARVSRATMPSSSLAS